MGATVVSTSQIWGKASNAGRGENTHPQGTKPAGLTLASSNLDQILYQKGAGHWAGARSASHPAPDPPPAGVETLGTCSLYKDAPTSEHPFKTTRGQCLT